MNFRLTTDRVDVYYVDLATLQEDMACYASMLDDSEQSRATRFHFERDRRNFILSHGWMRQLLASYLGVDAHELCFVIAERGKPYLDGYELQFNLSHSGGWAALALSTDPVGVDIQTIAKKKRFDELAKRYFCAQEYQQLQALPESQRLAAFYYFWTMKEAFLKATGRGIADGLHEYGFDCCDARLILVPETEKISEWRYQYSSQPDHWSLAVAVKGAKKHFSVNYFKKSQFFG